MTTTSNRRVIIVSEETLQRIDAARGDLERDEFLEACLDSLAGEIYEEAPGDEEVFCIIPGSPGSAWGVEFNAPVAGLVEVEQRRPSQPTSSASRPSSSERQLQPRAEEGQEEALPLGWWVPAVLLFGFGDTLTSALVFARGGVEVNPVMRFVLQLPGGMWSFAIVKTLIIAILMFLAARSKGVTRWLIPFITTVVGSYLVWHNLLQFLKK